jgi:MarR family transcriptional regulator, organic hydroperoxide resistance regulator
MAEPEKQGDTMTENTNVVVIGGGYAGVMAANRMTERADVTVTLINPRPIFVERIWLHQLVGGSNDAVVNYRDVLAPGVRLVVDRKERVSEERHPHAAEATELQDRFPVSYSIFAMARIHRAIAATELAKLGLFPNQDIMLIQLAVSDGLSQKTLAETLRVNHATVAKTVNRMEGAGLVARRTSVRDRRITLVYLTPAGRDLHDRIVEVWRNLDELTTRELSASDREHYLVAVTHIRRSLESAGETGPTKDAAVAGRPASPGQPE